MNMREDLKAFIDNEVSEQERTSILKEIENSPELQAEVIELRQMSRVIKEEAWQPQPVGLERTLGALASGGKRTPWWMGKSFQWAFGAGCIVIFASILFPVFAQSKDAAKSEASRSFDPNVQAGWPPQEGLNGSIEMKSESPAASAPAAHKGAAGEREMYGAPADKADMQGRGRVLQDDAKSNTRVPSLQENGWQDLRRSSGGALPVPSQPRYEIKTANLAVEVIDVPKAQQEAETVAKAVGGRVESSQKSDDEGQLASAELTFRVPVGSFEVAVNRIRKLGRVLNDSLNGQDVTGQVADTSARLKVMKAEEDQYVELLKATKKIGEVLSVKERLSQVRQEIESLEASNKVLKSQAAESTINLSLTEKPSENKPRQDPEWSEDAWSRAVSSLSSVGRGLGRAGVYLFVFSPIWIPVALLVWWLARRNRR